MRSFIKFASICLLAVLTVVCLYVSSAGWVKVDFEGFLKKNKEVPTTTKAPSELHGIAFKSDDAMKKAVEFEKAEKFCGWIFALPDVIALGVSALAFGFLGGILGIFKKLYYNKELYSERIFVYPFFTALSGLLVLGLAYVVPSVLTSSEVALRPVGLIFLCLLMGAFADEFFSWAQAKVKKLLE
jgi:hypothetical protein